MNPTINASMSVPEIVPDAPTVHAPKADWAGAAEKLLTGFGRLAEGIGEQVAADEKQKLALREEHRRQRAAQDKEMKEQQKVIAGNELAREVLRANQRLSQGKNQAQYDIDIRRIKDNVFARGILDATTVNSIVNGTDEGNMDISLESRKRFSKADDDAIIKNVNEMRARYKSLEGRSVDDVLSIYNKVNNSYDFAVEMQNKLANIDPIKYPEEYSRMKQERDSFFRNNTMGQLVLALSTDLATGDKNFQDPAQVEDLKQQYIEQQVSLGVARADAIISVEQAFKLTGAYDVYGDREAYLNLSAKDKKDIMDYRMTLETYGMYESNPQLYSSMVLMKEMGKEVYAEFSKQPGGHEFNIALAKNFENIAKGQIENLVPYADKGKAANTAEKIMKGNYNPLYKGSVGLSVLKDINKSGSALKMDDNQRAVVLSNSRGAVARFDTPFTDDTIRRLKTSNNTNDNVTGDMLEKEKQLAVNKDKAFSYIMSPNKGGQAFRELANSIVSDNIRVAHDGSLVYAAPQGSLETVGESIADWFMDYGDSIKTVNEDVKKVLGMQGEDLKNLWKAAGVPELSPSERPLSEPSFSREKSLAQERAERVEALAGNDERYELLDKAIKTIEKSGATEDEREFVSKLKNLRRASWWSDADKVRQHFQTVSEDPMFQELSTETKQIIGGKLYHEPTEAELLRQKADALEESTNKLSPAAMKEYGEGNRKTIEAARAKADELETSQVYGEARISSSEPLVFASLAPAEKNVEEDSEKSLSPEQRISQDVEKKAKEQNWNPLQKSSYNEYLNKFYKDVRKMREENVATFFHIAPEELEDKFLDIAFEHGLDIAYAKVRRWKKLIEEVKGWNEGMTTDQFQVYLNPDGTMTMGVKKPKGPYAGKEYEEDKKKLMNKRHKVLKDIYIYPGE